MARLRLRRPLPLRRGSLAIVGLPAMLSGLAIAAVLSLVPWLSNAGIPAWIADGALLVLGLHVGSKFTKEILVSVGRMLPTALAICVVLLGTCAALGLVLAAWTSRSPLDGYLATSPGGLFVSVAAASSTSGDVTFVSSAQLLRLVLALVCTAVVGWALRVRSLETVHQTGGRRGPRRTRSRGPQA